MHEDYNLLDRSLRILQQIKPWINAEYYQLHISGLVERLKDRLAKIEVNELTRAKKIERFNEPYDFSDTVPDGLNDQLSNFGIFREVLGEKCKRDPSAPHKHLKELSAALGRYVCQCEFWNKN